jgi:hypothetical protein
MLPSLAGPVKLRGNLRLTPITPSGLWPDYAFGRDEPKRNSSWPSPTSY